MAFYEVDLEPKKKKESFGGKVLRNVAGGAVKAIDYAAQGGPLKSIITSSLSGSNFNNQIEAPEGYKKVKLPGEMWRESLPEQYKTGKGQPLEYVFGLEPGYLSGKNASEDYAQHLISALGITGASGGLNTAGKNITEKAVSLGKSSLGTLGNVVASDAVRGTAKS